MVVVLLRSSGRILSGRAALLHGPHVVASDREGRKWYIKGDKFHYTADGVWQVTTFEYIDVSEIVIGGKTYKRIG